MKKKCKVVALATEKDNYALVKGDFSWSVKTPGIDPYLYGSTKYHLYLVSDDEIRIGDWYHFYSPEVNDAYVRAGFNNSIHQCTDIGLGHVASNSKMINPKMHCRKIIATTDPTLNLSLIPNSFVKSYCENPVGEVLVEYQQKAIYSIDDRENDEVVWVPVANAMGTASENPKYWEEMILYPVETSWNKDQIEFWLMENVIPKLSLRWCEFDNDLRKRTMEYLLYTLDDLGQRFKEFEEDQRADNYNNY